MKLVYALMHNTGIDHFEISGLYATLELAMAAVPIDWKKQEGLAIWEGWHPDGGLWCIEVHPLID